MGVPPGTSAALPSPDSFAQRWLNRWACRRLDRLGRELRRLGWATDLRAEVTPPLLRVFPPGDRSVGDSVKVVRGQFFWWFQSSTGAWLGPCTEPWRAADSVAAQFRMWGVLPDSLGGAGEI
jgi:hypothetical protein